jgi:hypothetical protein
MRPGWMRTTRIPRSANPSKKLGDRWSDDDDDKRDADAAAESASTRARSSALTLRASRTRAADSAMATRCFA